VRIACASFMKKGIPRDDHQGHVRREAKVAERNAVSSTSKARTIWPGTFFRAPLQQFYGRNWNPKVFAEHSAEGRVRRFVEESFRRL